MNFLTYDGMVYFHAKIKALLSGKEALIKSAEDKSLLADEDTIPFSDSETNNGTKKIAFANVKAALKSYFKEIMINLNLLINGDFKIWQRGESIVINSSAWTYAADRWRCKGTGTVSKVAGGLKVSAATVIQYAAETVDYNKLAGKTVTISYSKNDIIYSFTTAVSSAILVELSLAANDILNWVKLEVGSVATPFVPISYTAELALCQRYFMSYSYNCTGIAEYAEIPHGAGTAWLKYILPQNMRIQPSIVKTLGELEIFDNTSAWKTLSAVNSFMKGNIHIVEYSINNVDVTFGHSYLIKNIPDLDAEIY